MFSKLITSILQTGLTIRKACRVLVTIGIAGYITIHAVRGALQG